jgi:hypothetical protein
VHHEERERPTFWCDICRPTVCNVPRNKSHPTCRYRPVVLSIYELTVAARQVLRTEWRNLDSAFSLFSAFHSLTIDCLSDTLLLSLVDDTVSHARSLSEPSLPLPPPSSNSSPSTSTSVFDPSPDPSDERAISMPSLPPPISTVSAPSSSSLFHPAHDIYSVRSQSYPEAMSSDLFRTQMSSNLASWQLDNTVWHTAVDRFPSQQAESFRPSLHYPVASYDPPSSFHDYDSTPSPMVTSPLESRGFDSNYYGVPSHPGRGDPSSSVAPLPRASHTPPSLPLEAANHPTRAPMGSAPPYDSYNNPSSYPIPQPAPHDAYGNASMSYGTEPYQTHFSGQPQHPNPSHAPGMAGSASYDVVEPDFLPGVQHLQPQWLRPPATFQRPPDTPERHDRTPEP